MMGRAQNSNEIKTYDPEHPEALLQEGNYQAIIDGAGAFNNSSKKAAEALLNSNPKLKQVGYHSEEGVLTFIGESTKSLSKAGIVFNESHTRGTDLSLHPNAHAVLLVNSTEGFNNLAQEEGRLRLEGQTVDFAMPQDQAAATLSEVFTHAVCVDALQDAKDIYRKGCRSLPADLEDQLLKRLLALETIDEMVPIFGQPDFRKTFISKPEKSPEKPGDYFQEHRAIEKEDAPPASALEALSIKHAAKAQKLGIVLKNVDWSVEKLAKMPPLVRKGNLNAETEVLMELDEDIEAEIDAEIDLEESVEVEQGIEEDQMAAKGRAFFPPRRSGGRRAPANRIHPAYDPELYVTEAFLPFKRNETNPLYRRLPFEHSMYDVSGVYVNEYDVVVEDPLANGYDNFISSARIDLRDELPLLSQFYGEYPVRYLSLDQEPEIRMRLVQAKFLGGRLDGYSREELQDLSDWIVASDPVEMKRHLEEDILRFRYSDKKRLPFTQLGEVFRNCLP